MPSSFERLLGDGLARSPEHFHIPCPIREDPEILLLLSLSSRLEVFPATASGPEDITPGPQSPPSRVRVNPAVASVRLPCVSSRTDGSTAPHTSAADRAWGRWSVKELPPMLGSISDPDLISFIFFSVVVLEFEPRAFFGFLF